MTMSITAPLLTIGIDWSKRKSQVTLCGKGHSNNPTIKKKKANGDIENKQQEAISMDVKL